VWALPGGRMLRRESLKEAAIRIAKEYGLGFGRLYLVGVFPVSFATRSDISIAMAALDVRGQPIVDDVEFSKFKWSKNPPRNLGTNYRRMVSKWLHGSMSDDFLRLNKIP